MYCSVDSCNRASPGQAWGEHWLNGMEIEAGESHLYGESRFAHAGPLVLIAANSNRAEVSLKRLRMEAFSAFEFLKGLLGFC